MSALTIGFVVLLVKGSGSLKQPQQATEQQANQGNSASGTAGQNIKNAYNKARDIGKNPGQAGGNAAKSLANRAIGRNPNATPKRSPAQEARRKAVNKAIEAGGAAAGGPYGKIAAKVIILVKDNKKIRDIILYGTPAVVLFIFSFFLSGSPNPQAAQNAANATQTNPISVSVICSPTGQKGADLKAGDKSVCIITVSDTQSTDDISVVATIYKYATYVLNSATASSGNNQVKAGTYDAQNGTVTWDAKKLKLSLTAPVSLTFTITVTKTDPQATPIVVVANGSGGAGGGIPPNTNTCGGKYSADISKNWLLKSNFGDPQCDMPDNNAFATYLKQQDPTNGAKWFVVVQCESGYDPNTWRDPNESPHTPDASGAWGLFQIGSSAIMNPLTLYSSGRTATVSPSNVKQKPGLPMPTWGNGGQFDRGDTDWKSQVNDAINLLKARGWGYWGCA